MKKLMTILVVFAMCGVAMAQNAQAVDPKKPIDLTKSNDAKDYLNVKEDGTLGTSGLTYTVTNSMNAGSKNGYARQYAKGYFTVVDNVPADKVVAVQFLGAEVEVGNQYPTDKWGNPVTWNGENYGYDRNYKATDYGIYLYDPETGNRTSDYLSVKNYNNYFGEEAGVKAGTNFGVYFVDKNGNYIASTGDGTRKGFFGGYYEAENGMLGNFDDDSHQLKVYDTVTGEQYTKTTDKHFLCLSAGEYGINDFRQSHWEFMLQTTLDNPYYPVNPNDFNTDVDVDDPVVDGVSGQPLPGTLATLLIGGLCASSLRKRNKK